MSAKCLVNTNTSSKKYTLSDNEVVMKQAWSVDWWEDIRDLYTQLAKQQQPWVRNINWPALPTVLSTEEKIIGLYAVYPSGGIGGNPFYVFCEGAYTIDYGDGTITSYSSGAALSTFTLHEYDFDSVSLAGTDAPVTITGNTISRTNHGYTNGRPVTLYNITGITGAYTGVEYFVVNATTDTFQISKLCGGIPLTITGSGTASLLPYKIAQFTITPQAGSHLTRFVLDYTIPSKLLDITISMPNAIGAGIIINNPTVEQINIINSGSITSAMQMFNKCSSLQSVPLFDTSSVTDMGYMFNECINLQSVPLFDTSSVTNMNGMFCDCNNFNILNKS